jgi:hydroxysqualene synthase
MTDFRTKTDPPAFEAPPPPRPKPRRENFPVASRLIAPRLRPHVLAFYKFARLADDIADDPYVDPDAKMAYLSALERTLLSGRSRQPILAPAAALHRSLIETGVSDRHPRLLLQAFRRDAQGARCKTWNDLTAYCRLSAAPVGRYLLELHGENEGVCGDASDALCAALQVLNHVQDCRDDWRALGRCYIPTIWFDDAGLSLERLVETSCDARLRDVFDRTLDQTDRLLEKAAALPFLLADRRLGLEAAAIHALAVALAAKLRRRDPMAGRVRLNAAERVAAAARGVWRAFRRR